MANTNASLRVCDRNDDVDKLMTALAADLGYLVPGEMARMCGDMVSPDGLTKLAVHDGYVPSLQLFRGYAQLEVRDVIDIRALVAIVRAFDAGVHA